MSFKPFRIFPPHATDFYKTGHIRQYPPNTTQVYSNFTCRGDKYAEMLPGFDHRMVFFGLQGVCQWLLGAAWNEEFFHRPLAYVLERYKRRMDLALGVDAVATDHIEALHRLGYLPIRIKALPEGSRVDVRVPLWTITNTLPGFAWVTNYLETQLSNECWKSIVNATRAYEFRRLLDEYADKTGSNKDFCLWQGHDFSMRGMSGSQDAATSGAAWLTSFYGTDTIPALDYLDDYYYGHMTPLGGSIPATEHSVMCMGGKDAELDTIRRLITVDYPKGPISIVADTWDFWRVITEHATTLREVIINREKAHPGSKVVWRPDSGDPIKIICGDPEVVDDHPAHRGAAMCLCQTFGYTRTKTGHYTVDKSTGLVYGDSINLYRAPRMLAGLEEKKFASQNIVLGVGSYTLQYATRDTLGIAVKATFGVVDGQDVEIEKDPITDDGMKKSARGLLRVEQQLGHFELYERQTREGEGRGLLRTIFEDSRMPLLETIADIRTRLHPKGRWTGAN